MFMKEYSIVGKRVPPIDGRLKATGEAVFTVDMKLPGMLYGKVLRSPFPHARILNINKEFHILGKGLYTTPTVMVNQETYEGHSSPAYGFGADIAEVEVDRETGQVRILRIAGAHDCGQAINPMHAEGQLEGSAFQGLGQSLYEELILENGQVMNPSFLEYKVPTALDMPEIRTELVEEPDPGGPFGAKGMSEGSIIAVSPAIANAVYHAVGVRCKELPITPEKVLQALKEKDKGGATK